MMTTERAETLAAEALAWLAGDEERLAAFLGQSGADIDDLRRSADDPEFLAFVLDFLLGDETALVEFCAVQRIPPETPFLARAALPGGAVPNWT